MPSLKYTISFLDSDLDLIRFVEEKRKTQNFSAYIRCLIRKDMSNSQEKPDLEQIFEYVEKRLQESGIVVKDAAEVKMKEIVNEVDKELILNLF